MIKIATKTTPETPTQSMNTLDKTGSETNVKMLKTEIATLKMTLTPNTMFLFGLAAAFLGSSLDSLFLFFTEYHADQTTAALAIIFVKIVTQLSVLIYVYVKLIRPSIKIIENKFKLK